MTEFARLRDALRFLTLLPAGRASPDMAADWLARCMRYFPAIGVLIGLLSAAVFVVAHEVWRGAVPALLAIAASVALTGAFHEDGLADTADALGGGWDVEKRLAIMKDSRIGTYGACALGLGLALRVAALALLDVWTGAAALIAVHATARATPGCVMARLRYAGDIGGMKVAHVDGGLRRGEMATAFAIAALALAPLAYLTPIGALAGLCLGALLATIVARQAKRLLGGYTGDVLGAVEQMFEIGFLLGVAAVLA